MLAHVSLAFLFLHLPQNDTIPQRVGCHTAPKRELLHNLSFWWHHSGYYNDSKDQLQSKMAIAIGLRLLKSMVQDIFYRHKPGSLPISFETWTYKEKWLCLIKGSSFFSILSLFLNLPNYNSCSLPMNSKTCVLQKQSFLSIYKNINLYFRRTLSAGWGKWF